ncbi:MAG: ABC transporter ATP-binding protein [Bacillota bacterium]
MSNRKKVVLDARQIRKVFKIDEKEIPAIKGVDIQVMSGEFLMITGPSGSGKSTLLYMMGGLDTPSSGEVVINGQNLNSMSDEELTLFRRGHIGFVFQQFHLVSPLTARENIALPLLIAGVDMRQKEEKIEELGLMLGIEERLDHYPDQLSGGEQQRVAIARALVMDPVLIIADEPTGNLDSESGNQVMKLLKDVRNIFGSSVVMVTHNQELLRFGDRQVSLKDGVSCQ